MCSQLAGRLIPDKCRPSFVTSPIRYSNWVLPLASERACDVGFVCLNPLRHDRKPVNYNRVAVMLMPGDARSVFVICDTCVANLITPQMMSFAYVFIW